MYLFFSDTFKTLQTCMASISGVCEGNAIYDMTKQSLQGLESICSGTGKCATMNNNLEYILSSSLPNVNIQNKNYITYMIRKL